MRLSSIVATIALAAAATASGLVYAAYKFDLRFAQMRVAGAEVAQTQCGPLEYADSGAGDRAILLVHGAGGGFDQTEGFVPSLVNEGYRVVRMSRFGYLGTPTPADVSAESQADAHACLMDALGIRRAAMLGISAGGPSTIAFAARYPERMTAMLLLVPRAYHPQIDVGPPPGLAMAVVETVLRSDFFFWLMPRVAPSIALQAILATKPEVVAAATPQEQQRSYQILENILPVTARWAGIRNEREPPKRQDLERIATPTLVLSLEDDLFNTLPAARYTADHIPGARLVVYERGGHLWVGHDQEVMSEILGFLRGKWSVELVGVE